jgi:predicted DNA-binding protein (MmcQ/YjbR family)
MNIEEFREFCLSLKGTTEELPFDDNTLVFKVMGKMFALADINDFESINLKCDPEKAVELREKYSSVKAGYHMNKKHWNTIETHGELTTDELKHWILHSYDLVASKLTKAEKTKLGEL